MAKRYLVPQNVIPATAEQFYIEGSRSKWNLFSAQTPNTPVATIAIDFPDPDSGAEATMKVFPGEILEVPPLKVQYVVAQIGYQGLPAFEFPPLERNQLWDILAVPKVLNTITVLVVANKVATNQHLVWPKKMQDLPAPPASTIIHLFLGGVLITGCCGSFSPPHSRVKTELNNYLRIFSHSKPSASQEVRFEFTRRRRYRLEPKFIQRQGLSLEKSRRRGIMNMTVESERYDRRPETEWCGHIHPREHAEVRRTAPDFLTGVARSIRNPRRARVGEHLNLSSKGKLAGKNVPAIKVACKNLACTGSCRHSGTFPQVVVKFGG
ncbi:hypothetical protein C8R46DRAFT_1039722 [Mycena filopes]|nr:hypothetical protein C8R46DRAFT_1039722 [Mycena filopes]